MLICLEDLIRILNMIVKKKTETGYQWNQNKLMISGQIVEQSQMTFLNHLNILKYYLNFNNKQTPH